MEKVGRITPTVKFMLVNLKIIKEMDMVATLTSTKHMEFTKILTIVICMLVSSLMVFAMVREKWNTQTVKLIMDSGLKDSEMEKELWYIISAKLT